MQLIGRTASSDTNVALYNRSIRRRGEIVVSANREVSVNGEFGCRISKTDADVLGASIDGQRQCQDNSTEE
jgi:hypothetical protein